MLKDQDTRSLFQILDDIRHSAREWERKISKKVECDLCQDNDKCWWHRTGKEHVEFMEKH